MNTRIDFDSITKGGRVPRDRVVTMKDVAEHAGVSSSTVSRALAGTRAMSPEIRDRVLESAEELGYQVNLLGRALRQQRLNVVGLVVPDLENPFFAALGEQLGRTLREGGFDLLISSAGDRVEVEAQAIRSFLGQQIHALVVIPCDEIGSAAALRASQRRLPTVQFDRMVPALDVPFVGCDNVSGIAAIVRHVRQVTKEGEPIVFVGAGTASSSARERREAFLAAVPDAILLDGGFDVEWGREAARLLLERGMRRGTVVAAADVIALGVLSGFQRSGARIPEDFRVIGFDGIGVTGFAWPQLTTVRQPVEAMSEAILELIREGDAGASHRVLVEPEFRPGASSPSATSAGAAATSAPANAAG